MLYNLFLIDFFYNEIELIYHNGGKESEICGNSQSDIQAYTFSIFRPIFVEHIDQKYPIIN